MIGNNIDKYGIQLKISNKIENYGMLWNKMENME